MKKKTLFAWSSGKDSAWALHKLREKSDINLSGLFCTVNKKYDRVAMHGVRVELLKAQAASLNLPLEIIELPDQCSDEEYKKIMTVFIEKSKANHVECFAFGDLFLEDVKNYREEQLKDTGIEPIFPVWGLETKQLAEEMIASGLKTVITCVDTKQAPAELAGQIYSERFLEALPPGADPCGENGEFHSFVFDGPMFHHPLEVEVGESVKRGQFTFIDLQLKKTNRLTD